MAGLKRCFQMLHRLFTNKVIRFNYLTEIGFYNRLEDTEFLKRKFRLNMGYELNLNEPKTFNEKMQWLKVYYYHPLYSQLADKYAVRSFVESRIGGGILNTLYGLYDSFDEIDFRQLPEQFVIKLTHDSGSVVICKSKAKFDKDADLKKIRRIQKRNYFYKGREWPYKEIIPKIIIEKYLEDSNGELIDYKIFCFNGKPKIVQVDFDRFTGHKRNIYDTEWNYLGYEAKYPSDRNKIIEKPKCFEEMLHYAEKLSIGMPFVRVDFYNINDRLVFGEMTFFPDGGMARFRPQEWDNKLGEWLVLPDKHCNHL